MSHDAEEGGAGEAHAAVRTRTRGVQGLRRRPTQHGQRMDGDGEERIWLWEGRWEGGDGEWGGEELRDYSGIVAFSSLQVAMNFHDETGELTEVIKLHAGDDAGAV